MQKLNRLTECNINNKKITYIYRNIKTETKINKFSVGWPSSLRIIFVYYDRLGYGIQFNKVVTVTNLLLLYSRYVPIYPCP